MDAASTESKLSDASDAAESAAGGAEEDGPALPPEILCIVFCILDDAGCKASLLECALASKATKELVFPVLFARIKSRHVWTSSFLDAAARKHGHLVQMADMSERYLGREGTVACLAFFGNLRKLDLAADWEDDGFFLRLVSSMEKLEKLTVRSAESRHGHPNPPICLPPALKFLTWTGLVPDRGSKLAAALGPARQLRCLELDAFHTSEDFFNRLVPLGRVVAATTVLSLPRNELVFADALFRSPEFAPSRLYVGQYWRPEDDDGDEDGPTVLPPSLCALNGLEVLELSGFRSSFLAEQGSGLPPAKELVLKSLSADLRPDELAPVEAMLGKKRRNMRPKRAGKNGQESIVALHVRGRSCASGAGAAKRTIPMSQSRVTNEPDFRHEKKPDGLQTSRILRRPFAHRPLIFISVAFPSHCSSLRLPAPHHVDEQGRRRREGGARGRAPARQTRVQAGAQARPDGLPQLRHLIFAHLDPHRHRPARRLCHGRRRPGGGGLGVDHRGRFLALRVLGAGRDLFGIPDLGRPLLLVRQARRRGVRPRVCVVQRLVQRRRRTRGYHGRRVPGLALHRRPRQHPDPVGVHPGHRRRHRHCAPVRAGPAQQPQRAAARALHRGFRVHPRIWISRHLHYPAGDLAEAAVRQLALHDRRQRDRMGKQRLRVPPRLPPPRLDLRGLRRLGPRLGGDPELAHRRRQGHDPLAAVVYRRRLAAPHRLLRHHPGLRGHAHDLVRLPRRADPGRQRRARRRQRAAGHHHPRLLLLRVLGHDRQQPHDVLVRPRRRDSEALLLEPPHDQAASPDDLALRARVLAAAPHGVGLADRALRLQLGLHYWIQHRLRDPHPSAPHGRPIILQAGRVQPRPLLRGHRLARRLLGRLPLRPPLLPDLAARHPRDGQLRPPDAGLGHHRRGRGVVLGAELVQGAEGAGVGRAGARARADAAGARGGAGRAGAGGGVEKGGFGGVIVRTLFWLTN